jgi:hypothetical protein
MFIIIVKFWLQTIIALDSLVHQLHKMSADIKYVIHQMGKTELFKFPVSEFPDIILSCKVRKQKKAHISIPRFAHGAGGIHTNVEKSSLPRIGKTRDWCAAKEMEY